MGSSLVTPCHLLFWTLLRDPTTPEPLLLAESAEKSAMDRANRVWNRPFSLTSISMLHPNRLHPLRQVSMHLQTCTVTMHRTTRALRSLRHLNDFQPATHSM